MIKVSCVWGRWTRCAEYRWKSVFHGEQIPTDWYDQFPVKSRFDFPRSFRCQVIRGVSIPLKAGKTLLLFSDSNWWKIVSRRFLWQCLQKLNRVHDYCISHEAIRSMPAFSLQYRSLFFKSCFIELVDFIFSIQRDWHRTQDTFNKIYSLFSQHKVLIRKKNTILSASQLKVLIAKNNSTILFTSQLWVLIAENNTPIIPNNLLTTLL